MAIILPRLHRATDYSLIAVEGKRVARSATGGSRQPNDRTGDHFSVEVAAGALSPVCARALLVDVLRGVGEPLRLYLPKVGVSVGSPGLPKVAGAGQVGGSLNVDGFTASYLIKKGYLFTLVTDESPSLHIVAEDTEASAGGVATVSFWPLVRNIPADNTALEFEDPFIQGTREGEAGGSSGLADAIFLESFTIEEDD